MNDKVKQLMNEQINKELHSSYVYLGISKFFAERTLNGFAYWYMVQAQEEQQHALKIYNYLMDNDIDVSLADIKGTDAKYSDVLDAVKAADRHEKYITGEIHKIYAAAEADQDYRTKLFLNWFITEQEEEERHSREMIAKVEMFAYDPKSLYLLDSELGERKC